MKMNWHIRAAVVAGVATVAVVLANPVVAAPKLVVTILSTSSSSSGAEPLSVSCMSAGNCVVSEYSSNNRAFVQAERDGHWERAIEATKSLGKIENSILVTTACFKNGCIGFGRFTRSQRTQQDSHFTISYLRGQWHKAVPVALKLGPARPERFRSSVCRVAMLATAWWWGHYGTPRNWPAFQFTRPQF